MHGTASPSRRRYGEFKNTMSYLLSETEKHLNYKIDEPSEAAMDTQNDLRMTSTVLNESIASPRMSSGGFYRERQLPVSPAPTKSFQRQAYNQSAPPLAPMEAWYEKPPSSARGAIAASFPKDTELSIRLDKVESDSSAFRERMVGDIEGAFKNAVKRIENLREDMLRIIRSNSNDLEAQLKLKLANTVEDSNQLHQRISAQITQVKREGERNRNGIREQAMSIDRVAQKVNGMNVDLKQCQAAASKFSEHDFADLAGKIEQNELNISRISHDEKTRNASTGDAIERLQSTVDRLSSELRALQSSTRTSHEQQSLEFDEKIRQMMQMQKKRQEAVEEQFEEQLQELKKSTERNLLASVRDISEEHVRLNTTLVELHSVVDENLAHQHKAQEADKIEREQLQKLVEERVGELRLAVDKLSLRAEKSESQAQEAVALARKAEMGREADRKKLEAALSESSKRGESIVDCKRKVEELGHELRVDMHTRQKQLDSLERSTEALKEKGERERSKITRDLQKFENLMHSKLTKFDAAQKSHGDEVQATQRLASNYNSDLETKLKDLETKLKVAGHKQGIEMLEKRLSSLTSTISTKIDVKVSEAMQSQASRTSASIDQRMESLYKSMRETTGTLKEQLSTLDSRVTGAVDKFATGNHLSGDVSSNVELKLQAMKNEIQASKEEVKRKISLSRLDAEAEVKRVVGEQTTKFDKSSVETRRRITGIEEKMKSMHQLFSTITEELGTDRKRLEYCSSMIFEYGKHILKDSEVRDLLHDMTAKLCSRVASLETKSGMPIQDETFNLSNLANQKKELDTFNRMLSENIKSQMRLGPLMSTPDFRPSSTPIFTSTLDNNMTPFRATVDLEGKTDAESWIRSKIAADEALPNGPDSSTGYPHKYSSYAAEETSLMATEYGEKKQDTATYEKEERKAKIAHDGESATDLKKEDNNKKKPPPSPPQKLATSSPSSNKAADESQSETNEHLRAVAVVSSGSSEMKGGQIASISVPQFQTDSPPSTARASGSSFQIPDDDETKHGQKNQADGGAKNLEKSPSPADALSGGKKQSEEIVETKDEFATQLPGRENNKTEDGGGHQPAPANAQLSQLEGAESDWDEDEDEDAGGDEETKKNTPNSAGEKTGTTRLHLPIVGGDENKAVEDDVAAENKGSLDGEGKAGVTIPIESKDAGDQSGSWDSDDDGELF